MVYVPLAASKLALPGTSARADVGLAVENADGRF